jgi:pyridoxal phosphate enzyme (YggS family)
MDLEPVLARNLAAVRDRIARAEARAGRAPGGTRLVAVTKSVPAEVAAALVRLGARELGENRVQDLAGKLEALRACGVDARFHMIGHLQRNKVKAVLKTGAFLHAIDSERLAEALEAALPEGPPRPCFVEVNVSGEPQKGGLAPEDLAPFLERRAARGRLAPAGLMTMAPLDAPGERARPCFARLRGLREELAARFPALVDLSMGMTQDFEAAVEEGASVVRVGRALFEGL